MDEEGPDDVNRSELTEKQLHTLRLIERDPDALQSDVAEEFDVTRATIGRWLNDIPGSRWGRRREIDDEILNGDEIDERDEREERGGQEGRDYPGRSEAFETLHERLDALERRIDRVEATSAAPGIDPELAHKVVHAPIESDRITGEGELELPRELMT